jgi:hypothetical protein
MPHLSRAQDHQSKADTINQLEGRKPKYVKRRAESVKIMREVHAGPGGLEQYVALLTEFVDDVHDMAIIREPMVVEFLQSRSADVETSCQSAHVAVRLEHLDIEPTPSEIIGRGETAEACSDNYNSTTSMIDHVAFLSGGQMAIEGRDGLTARAGSRPRPVSGNQNNR